MQTCVIKGLLHTEKGFGVLFQKKNIKDPKYTDRVDTHKRLSSENATLKPPPARATVGEDLKNKSKMQ